MPLDAGTYGIAAVLSLSALVATGSMGVLYVRERRARLRYQSRFAGVVDADHELARVTAEKDARQRATNDLSARYAIIEARYAGVTGAEEIIGSLEGETVTLKADIATLRAQYREKKVHL